MCQQRINQEGHLKHVFSMLVSLLAASLDTLQQHSAALAAALASDGPFNWLEPCVAVINQIFGWDFSDSESKVLLFVYVRRVSNCPKVALSRRCKCMYSVVYGSMCACVYVCSAERCFVA